MVDFCKLKASYAENPQGSIDLYSLQNVYAKFNPSGSRTSLILNETSLITQIYVPVRNYI